MPYKDPEKERQRQMRRLKNGHGAAYLEASAWADSQISMLKKMGIQHTPEEWRMLRADLCKSRLNAATRVVLYTPSPTPTN